MEKCEHLYLALYFRKYIQGTKNRHISTKHFKKYDTKDHFSLKLHFKCKMISQKYLLFVLLWA